MGLDGSVLDLFRSYMSGRTQCVSVDGVLSELSELYVRCSPRLGSEGPIEFCIYTIPLGAIMRHYKIEYHIYADEARHAIHICISDIRSWMIGKKLNINDDKTEFLIITSSNARFSANVELKIGLVIHSSIKIGCTGIPDKSL